MEKIVQLNSEKEVNIDKCKICEKVFGSKDKMKDHIKKSQSETGKVYIVRKVCKEKFVKHCDLEKYLKTYNTDTTQFKCGKIFVSEWRRKKHKTVQEKTATINCCHFFNNKERMPI